MAEEFYTHELQEKMDVSKWLDSEQAHRDLCGNYEYCAFCNKAEEFPCANAYVRMTEKENAEKEREALAAAEAARACGLGLNAGHDLNLVNLEYFIRSIPWTDEVSIGHAIICDALYMGLEKTIKAYLSKIKIF